MNNIAITVDKTNVIHNSFRRGIVSRIVDRYRIWKERKAAIRQLSGMSDRMLRDIGIERHEIHASVTQPRASVKMVSERTGKPEVSVGLRKAA